MLNRCMVMVKQLEERALHPSDVHRSYPLTFFDFFSQDDDGRLAFRSRLTRVGGSWRPARRLTIGRARGRKKEVFGGSLHDNNI